MSRPAVEVADIFRRHGPRYRQTRRLPFDSLRVMRAIEICRTAALGGHVEQCGHCHHRRVSYNSCRNRHCPKCQNTARAEWVERRKGELLPIEYFHVVFTIPEPLHDVALANPRVVYRLLMAASARTLETIAANPKHLGARIGFFSVLHTWGQNLLFHSHVHTVATGGGLSPDGECWVSCRPGFFLPVRVLSALFRRLLLPALKTAFEKEELQFQDDFSHDGFLALLDRLAKLDWVVYAKPPFGGPAQVVDYLGRYTHRVASANQRLIAADDGGVTFHYKQYRSGDSHRVRRMTLAPEEFIRRFLLHTLPSGFQRIRHYGLFSSRNKNTLLELCRLLLAEAASLLPSPQQLKEVCRALTESAAVCPACQVGRMVRIDVVEVSSFATVRWQSVWGRPSVCLPASSIAPLPALKDSVGLLFTCRPRPPLPPFNPHNPDRSRKRFSSTRVCITAAAPALRLPRIFSSAAPMQTYAFTKIKKNLNPIIS